jgi:hypothetical protein
VRVLPAVLGLDVATELMPKIRFLDKVSSSCCMRILYSMV